MMTNIVTIFTIFIMIDCSQQEIITYNQSKYLFNSCPCGLTNAGFEKQLKTHLIKVKSVQIMSKLPKSRRKRNVAAGVVEMNYTVAVEKIANQNSKK